MTDRAVEAGQQLAAAICHIQVALAAIYPVSPLAAAVVRSMPASWPFPIGWDPEFSDPLAALETAATFFNVGYGLLTDGSSFDDADD